MDSRPILKVEGKIRVLLDSKSFDKLLKQNNRLAIAILRFYNSELLDFIRTPFETEFEELKNVVPYELERNGCDISTIRIVKNKSNSILMFGYRTDSILSTARIVCRKDTINPEELDRINTVFIQAVFNTFEKSNIYITNDKLLLKNRLWFERHFPGYQLNIMSVEESSLFLDLFLKNKGQYLASDRYILSKYLWYWLSMRLKLAHYNVGEPMLDALANRFCYALMALDEIGILHYLGANSETMQNTLYHFNYLITLITGIFDNLALITNTNLGINYEEYKRVSINNNSGKDFLRKVRGKRPDIREHIANYVEFINLIYSFRELVLHREGLDKAAFEFKGQDSEWKANFIKVDNDLRRNLNACGDKDSEHDPFTNWGFYQNHTECFINPYSFSLKAIEILIEFVEKYLQLLGYPLFIETQRKKDNNSMKTLQYFKKCHLGF